MSRYREMGTKLCGGDTEGLPRLCTPPRWPQWGNSIRCPQLHMPTLPLSPCAPMLPRGWALHGRRVAGGLLNAAAAGPRRISALGPQKATGFQVHWAHQRPGAVTVPIPHRPPTPRGPHRFGGGGGGRRGPADAPPLLRGRASHLQDHGRPSPQCPFPVPPPLPRASTGSPHTMTTRAP